MIIVRNENNEMMMCKYGFSPYKDLTIYEEVKKEKVPKRVIKSTEHLGGCGVGVIYKDNYWFRSNYAGESNGKYFKATYEAIKHILKNDENLKKLEEIDNFFEGLKLVMDNLDDEYSIRADVRSFEGIVAISLHCRFTGTGLVPVREHPLADKEYFDEMAKYFQGKYEPIINARIKCSEEEGYKVVKLFQELKKDMNTRRLTIKHLKEGAYDKIINSLNNYKCNWIYEYEKK